MVHPMMPEQLRLEEEMREETRNRYFRVHEKADDRGELADTHAGRNVFDAAFETFLQGINDWVAAKKAGKAGKRPRAVKLIDDFGDTETMAYIFLRHLINTTSFLTGRHGAAKKTRAVLQCTQAIHDELRMRYFADNRKPLMRQLIKDFQQRDLPRRRRRELMIKQFHVQQLEWQAEGWSQVERLNLGVVLLDIFQRTTGMIEEYTVTDGPRTVTHIAFTQEMVDNVSDRMDRVADMLTMFYPTVVPPRRWENHALVGGGYYSENVKPYRFVKGAKIKFLMELENRDLSRALEPINALQETAWRVNPVMLEVLDFAFTYNLEVKGLPRADPKEIPEPPVGIEEDEDIAAEYRKDCYMVHDENRRMISKRLSVLRTVSLARKFKGYSAIYFPYDVDTRGRTYPKVPFLNPQGTDYVKSLLEFAEGKPIETSEQAAYLAIAVANAWGQDKLPLQQRVEWVEDNEVMLQEVANDPLRDLRWLKADEPFMALRGALEWQGYCQEGSGFMSHMPIHFDATCSGLQHFSALLRDDEGGFHVNLTDSDERQDIYAAVAKKAEASLTRAANTCDIARTAVELGISRSLCKRPVMIVPYAGTFSSCMEYVYDHYKERLSEGEVLNVDTKYLRTKLVPLVSKHVWSAISDTVIAARHAMDWITKSARIVSKATASPITWTTPDGFIAIQEKYVDSTARINTYLDGGRRVRSTLVTPTNKLDPRKMSQSLSPNFIHSLDAYHMRATILRAMEIGNMSFAMIHDSFGVHAADMPVFVSECIRPAFVEMYDGKDLLAQFSREITSGISEFDWDDVKSADKAHIENRPPMGKLEVKDVALNQFFFS